ncbi:Uncharacterized protein TCM_001233 [Theobroma cacao]|uniref:Uncharacterized protein n=1 Tax=Theobroma cacao TaxID=3641 RepID=A0A061DI89_THECC|nr:Uncharacterized protein TCM_001233 [Theobroma cacao]
MSCHGSITISISIFSNPACVESTSCHQTLSIADPSSTIVIVVWMSTLSSKRKEAIAITLEMICTPSWHSCIDFVEFNSTTMVDCRISSKALIFLPSHGILLSFSFPVPVEINLERSNIILKSQRCHSPQKIIPVYSFPLFPLTLIRSLTRDEADELGYTFLDSFFGFFGYFCICWEGFFHDSTYISYGKETVLFFGRTIRDVPRRWAADGAAGLVSFSSHGRRGEEGWL